MQIKSARPDHIEYLAGVFDALHTLRGITALKAAESQSTSRS